MTRCSQFPGTGPNAQPADHPPPTHEGAARHKRAWPCQQTPGQRRSVPTPSQSVQLEGRPAMHPAGGPQYEWRAMLPPPSPKAAPPGNKARSTADIIETAAAVASLADASRRHQLNVVPPVLVRIPRPLQPDPDMIPCPQPPLIPCVGAGLSAGLHAAAVRPDDKASHAPCTVQHRILPSTDAQTP